MGKRSAYHVVPTKDGDCGVKKEGGSRMISSASKALSSILTCNIDYDISNRG